MREYWRDAREPAQHPRSNVRNIGRAFPQVRILERTNLCAQFVRCAPPGRFRARAGLNQPRCPVSPGRVLQQQLLGIASALALAGSVAGQDDERERALIARLKAETSGALATLRELARGIYPPLLADQGLAAALQAQAAKAPGPVEVSTDGIGRYPAEIETAVYFCCVEALQNAARHAPGSAVRVSLADTGHGPEFEVADDGPGFDPAAVARSGLRNASDRLAAVGGSCRVDSGPGRGDRVGTAEHGRPAGRARRFLPGRLRPRPGHDRRRPGRDPRCGATYQPDGVESCS